MRKQHTNSRRAFTLIELLTVVAIIGILAGMLSVVIPLVKTKAQIAKYRAIYQGWVGGIEQYKAAYSTYPVFTGTSYDTSKDTFVQLNSESSVTEFIKSLSGRSPVWDGSKPLSTGTGGEARKYNRQATPFVEFDTAAYAMDDNGGYKRMLSDGFGNTNIRLLMDTDGNGLVKPTDIKGTPSDYGIDTNGNISHKVIIYTLRSDNPAEYKDVLSWQ